MPPREQNQCFLRESEEVIIQLAHSSSSSFDGLFLQLLIMQYHQSLFCYVPLTYYKRATASKSRQDESIGGDKKKGDSLSWSSLMMSLCRLQHGHSLAKSARLTPPFPIPSIFSPQVQGNREHGIGLLHLERVGGFLGAYAHAVIGLFKENSSITNTASRNSPNLPLPLYQPH